MKLAFLSDVHGNLQALQAVLQDLERAGAEAALFLGDAVGYGANPNEVVELIGQHCQVRIMGNHDAGALGLIDSLLFNDYARTALDYTDRTLSEKARQILGAAKMSYQLDEIFLVHATPEAPDDWRYCLTAHQAERQFEYFDSKLCCLGHSHWPVVFQQNPEGEVSVESPGEHKLRDNCRYLINVGSVGQPRDGNPRACYVLYDNDTRALQYRRVDYDIAAAQEVMAAHNLPEFLIERIAGGR